MNISSQPYADTIVTAQAFLNALAASPINEFILLDRADGSVVELCEKEPGTRITFREPPAFACSVYAENLRLQLARWLQALPVYGIKGDKGSLFGAVVPNEQGEFVVSVASVSLV